MAPSPNVLVFGPTGGVGRAAALFARNQGATVWLAMRDPSKSISQLDASDPGYQRVRADLTDPASLAAAVEKSSAKTAFVYCMFGVQDAMAASFAALKAGGITYVVLLSSYTVQGAASDEKNKAGFLSRCATPGSRMQPCGPCISARMCCGTRTT
jgi:NAD(P)-dependent dehydrogenase (short-subunit alcohol dehydrogenase family)